jgi:cation:H+ antiporter
MLAVAGGLVLLLFGGEALVRGSVALAGRLRISKVVVGMVIVGFGTSAPELVVSVQAALAGSPEIAIGNIVGSNIANILLIIGIAALLAPLASCDRAIRREALIMLAVSLGLALLLPAGHLGRLSGLAMLALFLILCLVDFDTRAVIRPANLAPPAGSAHRPFALPGQITGSPASGARRSRSSRRAAVGSR